MKPKKVFYRGNEVKVIFNLVDETKVDIGLVGGKQTIRNAEKSELMIRMVDAEKEFKELEDKIEKIKEILQ